MNCPICERPLTVWYSLHGQEAVCHCQNPHCHETETIEGTGESTAEAIEKFKWLAMRKMGAKR